MNRSLTLCASLALLTSFAAAEGLEGFEFGIGVGALSTTMGKADDSNRNLIADTKTGTEGFVKSIGYSRPTMNVGGKFKFGEGRFKISVDAIVSSSDTLNIYDGGCEDGVTNAQYSAEVKTALRGGDGNYTATTSTEAKFGAPTATGTLVTLENGTATNHTDITGGIEILATPGTRKVTVDPQAAFALSAEYTFGEDADGASLGLGILRTSDEFKYTGSGPTATATAPTAGTDAFAVAGNKTTSSHTAHTHKYDESQIWYGPCASTSSEVTDNLKLRASLAYYMTEFDTKTDAAAANLHAKSTDATCFMGSASIVFNPSSEDDS